MKAKAKDMMPYVGSAVNIVDGTVPDGEYLILIYFEDSVLLYNLKNTVLEFLPIDDPKEYEIIYYSPSEAIKDMVDGFTKYLMMLSYEGYDKEDELFQMILSQLESLEQVKMMGEIYDPENVQVTVEQTSIPTY